MSNPSSLEYDVIVVGSGPGGAAIARLLAQQGQRVLLLERGKDHRAAPYYGTYLGALLYTDRRSFLYTEEGLNIIRPLMVGGATSMYCGSAAPPPLWLKSKYGVDIDSDVETLIHELDITPLPESLRGAASTRLAQAAQELGYDWQAQPKFMKPALSEHFNCGARCMLGCRCRAKWNAGEFVDEAVKAGARLITSAHVRKVLIEDGVATGVVGSLARRPFTARAHTIILAAGGLGSPRILLNSGIAAAGQGIAMDTTVMVYGVAPGRGNGNEPPMSWGWHAEEAGFMLSTLVDPWLNYPLAVARLGLRYTLSWARWNRMLGVMIKLKDQLSGEITPDGRIHKPLTVPDQEKMTAAEAISHRILVKAGADPGSLFTTPLRGTHPSATVRLGHLLDKNLQTEIPNLYVCDASAFPEALGQPTVLTILGLASRLARHLLTAEQQTVRHPQADAAR